MYGLPWLARWFLWPCVLLGGLSGVADEASRQADTSTSAASRFAAAAEDSSRDNVCGPRCVRFLLSYYGKGQDVELIDLVREVQWPDMKSGATLSDLANQLRKYEIHTAMLKVSPKAELCWRHPVLVHLKSTGDGPGHYVVWLPESTESEAHVWSGLAGTSEVAVATLARKMSGNVLLTADTPIVDPQGAVLRTRDAIFWDSAKVVVLGCGVTVVFFGWRRLWARFRFPRRPLRAVDSRGVP